MLRVEWDYIEVFAVVLYVCWSDVAESNLVSRAIFQGGIRKVVQCSRVVSGEWENVPGLCQVSGTMFQGCDR